MRSLVLRAVRMLSVIGVAGLCGAACSSAEQERETGKESVSRTLEALGSSGLVVSQVYGGGGNSGATYKNDFIELFNRGTTSVSVSGWSVQYASATGSSWSLTNLSGTIQPGHYYLIQESQGAGGTTNLPTPDATGSISMSATSAKVALVNDQTALTCSTSCLPNSHIVDLVGYGSSASSYEGSGPTATLSNTTSASRAGAGCTDNDNNAADFTAGTVNPRNSSSATTSCGQQADAGADTGTDSGTDAGGGVTLPAPTLAPVTLSSLSFGMTGDTRPPQSQTTHYSTTLKNIIGSVFSGFQSQGVAFAVGSGDYAFSGTASGDAVPQYDDYMTARANFSGKYLPTMGNHECNGYTDSNCPIGSFTGMTQDYVNVIVQPTSGQTSPYYSALYKASDGSWTAKFIFTAANAWDSTQNTWLNNTLNVATTYTFIVRHEPANDARAPGVTPSENLMSPAYSAGHLTLSITGHTHLVQLPGGTQPYGDPYGSTLAYEMIVGNGGARSMPGATTDTRPPHAARATARWSSRCTSPPTAPAIPSSRTRRTRTSALRSTRTGRRTRTRSFRDDIDCARVNASVDASAAGLDGSGARGRPRRRRRMGELGSLARDDAGRASSAGDCLADSARAQSAEPHPNQRRDRGQDRVGRRGGNTGNLKDSAGQGMVPYTQARVRWGDGNLYFMLYAGDLDLEGKVTQPDTSLEGDDSFRLEFEAGKQVRVVTVSVRGAVYDALCDRSAGAPACDTAWQSGAKVAVDADGTLDHIGDNDEEWVVEMSLPLSSLGIGRAAPGVRIPFSVRRCEVGYDGVHACGSWGAGERRGELVLDP